MTFKRYDYVQYIGDTVPSLTGKTGHVKGVGVKGWIQVEFASTTGAVNCADVNLRKVATIEGDIIYAEGALEFPIFLFYQGKGRFAVAYGLSTNLDLSRDDAATAFGSAVMHALECAGKLDDD